MKKTHTNTLPKRPRIRTTWDLKGLYYTSEHDPRIEKDIQKVERAYEQFARTYRSADFTSSPARLKKALQDMERLSSMKEAAGPGRYFAFRHVLNAQDHVAEKKLNLLTQRLTKAENEVLFFELRIAKLPKKQQKVMLASPELAPFHYFLERTFLEAQHVLNEDQEKILNLKSNPASSMWVAATNKMLASRFVTFNRKSIPLNEAIEMVSTLASKEKPKLWSLIIAQLKELSEVAENELTAVITNKRIDDELRSYPHPYSATILGYEDNEKSVLNLVDVVSSTGFSLSRRFYRDKAQLHGVKHLDYSQKYDPIGKTSPLPFDDAVDICREVFYGVHNTYGTIFDEMLASGRIDVFPRKGKQGGAFMSGDVNQPTQVFLNHMNDFKSLETLAHEMGHAIHTERSKTQRPFYQQYSTTTAETASTLFENLLFAHVYRGATEKERAVLLHDRIGRDIATVQRQIAFFNFELDLHHAVRNQGAITKTELRDLMTKHLRAYLGNGVNVKEDDGYSYVYVSHFRYGFYVYTYAFGMLMSSLMAQRLTENPQYAKEIDRFLTSGGSDTVANIFKSIGFNTNDPETFKTALTQHGDQIRAFGSLVKKRK